MLQTSVNMGKKKPKVRADQKVLFSVVEADLASASELLKAQIDLGLDGERTLDTLFRRLSKSAQDLDMASFTPQ